MTKKFEDETFILLLCYTNYSINDSVEIYFRKSQGDYVIDILKKLNLLNYIKMIEYTEHAIRNKIDAKIRLKHRGKKYIESLSGSEIIDVLYHSNKFFMKYPKLFGLLCYLYEQDNLSQADIAFILTYNYNSKMVTEISLPSFTKFLKENPNGKTISQLILSLHQNLVEKN